MRTPRPIRWLANLTWSALIALLMLTPGEDSLAEDVSGSFGGTELSDWLGHVFLFAIFALLLYWLTRAYQPRCALLLTTAIAIPLALLTEVLQHWIPYRGVTLYDLLGNVSGVLLIATLLRYFHPDVSG